MDDVKEFVKKYWPYIVGGIVGLYLILRFSAGGSGGTSSSGDGGYGAFLQAQTAAGAQNAALQLQANAQAAQLALDSKALDAQIAKDNAIIDMTKAANYASAFNDFQLTQAAMAESIGGSTAQIIDALNAPSITAMQASAFENAAALEAAGVVAANSFLTQGGIVAESTKTTATVIQSLTRGIAELGNLGGEAPKGKYSTAFDYAGRAYGAYATGGMSEAYRSTSGAGTVPQQYATAPQYSGSSYYGG